MPKSDGSVIINTKLNTSGFEKGAKGLKSQFSSLGSSIKKLGRMLGAAFSVRAIVNFSKEAIQLGSDLQEVQNVVDVTFRTMSSQVNAFAKNAKYTAGLSETMAKRYAGSFGAMANSYKFAEAESLEMATTLTQLAGDVASFYNISQDEAYTKLSAVFTGETEALKHLGVVMTENALQEYAWQKGIQKTISKMTEREKVALRYEFVLERLSDASGDFVRTQDNWANQTRLLSAQFDQLKATLGQGLINALTPVVKLLNEIIAKLQSFAEAFKRATALLFGDASSSSAGTLGDAAANAGELADNITAAGKAAKKTLAGFDELNVLVDQSSGGGSGGTSSGGIDIGQIESSTDQVTSLFQQAADGFTKLYFEILGKLDVQTVHNFNAAITNLESGWKNLVSTIEGGSIDIADLIANQLNDSTQALGGDLKKLGALFDIIAEFRKYNAENDTNSAVSLDAFFTKDVWDAMGEWGAGMGQSMTPYIGAFEWIGISKEEWEDLFLPITEEFTNFYRELPVTAAAALKKYQAVQKDFADKLNKLNWSDAIITEADVEDVKSKAEEVFSAVLAANETARAEAEAGINDLFTQGLLSDEEAQAAISALNDAHAAQQALVEQNQQKINNIIQARQKEGRSLTEADSALILQLTQEYNDKTVGVISKGAGEVNEIDRLLSENRENMSKTTLSQIVQYANQERDNRIKAANETYEASIANADRLYNDLGVINEEQYLDIKQNAEKTRDEQIKDAEETRNGVVEQAQKQAGEVANAVDPETGEILSNWESLWNSMLTEVKAAWESIKQTCKNFINGIIGFINTPINNMNRAFDQIAGTEIFGYKLPEGKLKTIPYLAKGAVIPPNAPFMAVLGDQRHGTNIEAPESLIRNIFAEELANMTSGMMAGFNALLEENRMLRSAVEGIELGDSTIGQAAERYNRNLSMIYGG